MVSAAVMPSSIITTEQFDRPLEDYRNYKFLKLNNKLQILLVSDEKADKAAACMAVRIGSLFDDRRCQGLAHFLEHMLFLGTTKYPKEDAYNEYLAKNSGGSNAYTSNTQTVYYFHVGKDHLDGGLDRFAQFFLEPLFTESATNRELEAVHSEHTKNTQSDNWRCNQLLKSMFVNEKHPLNRFNTGNKETLVDDPLKHDIVLREKLLEFHEKYYSANIMTLAVLGKESLEQLEEMVVSKFAQIVNKDVHVPHGSAIADGMEGISAETLQTQMSVLPVKDMKTVMFNFKLPEQWMHWKSKPSKYLSHLIGHEGKGSLFSILKKNNLATELCAGLMMDEGGVCMFSVDIQVTEKGQDHIDEVGEMLIAYIKIMQQEREMILSGNLPNGKSTFELVYEEMKNIDAMGFRFRSLSDPTSAVMNLATKLQEPDVPPQQVMSAHSLLWEYDEKLVLDTLKELNLENLQIVRVGKKYEQECSETEHWYGTKHSKIEKLSNELLNKWSNPRDGIKDFGMELFNVNPFIAENLQFKKLEGEDMKYPGKYVIDSHVKSDSGATLHLYHKQDITYRLPKMVLGVNVFSPWAASSIKNQMLTEIWCQSLSEQLTEFAYDAEIAGLSYQMAAGSRGCSIEFGGYDDKLGALLDAVLQKVVNLNSIDEATWNLVWERMDRDLKSASKSQPYQQALKIQRRLSNTESAETLLFSEKYDLFKTLTRKDSDGINYHIFGEPHHTEGLLMGNVQRSETKDLFEKHFIEKIGHLAPKGQSPAKNLSNIPNRSNLFLKPGKHLHARFKGTHDAETNGAVTLTLQVGRTSVPTWMMTSLYSQITSQKFFDQLRTKDQLGYIVASQPVKTIQKSELLFLVQSEKDPKFCMERVNQFINKMQSEYFGSNATIAEENAKTTKEGNESSESEGLNPDVFNEYRNALINQLEEKPKKLIDEFHRHWVIVKERSMEFSRRDESIEFLKQLKYSDFLQFARTIGLSNLPSICVEVYPEAMWKETDKLDETPKADGSQTKYFTDSVSELKEFVANVGDYAEWIEDNNKIEGEKLSKL